MVNVGDRDSLVSGQLSHLDGKKSYRSFILLLLVFFCYFLHFLLIIQKNLSDLLWSLCLKWATGEDPECSLYMAAHVCWCSHPGELEGHSGSALVSKGHRLDAGKDFPLMPSQSHSHVQQIPETQA